MTLAVWPAELPQRVVTEGFSRGIDDARLFTQMDSGLDKSRVRGIAAEPVAAQMEITGSQFLRWKRFWKDDLAGGVLPFKIRDQNFDGLPIANEDDLIILNQDDLIVLGTYFWLVIFGKETPQITSLGGGSWYRLSFTLLILPP